MTTEQAFQKIRGLQLQALEMAGQVALAHVRPFVPIDNEPGKLRSSGKVEVGAESVDLVFGGQGSGAEKYAQYQYSKAEMHFTDGSSLGRILQLIPSSITKKVKGQKNSSRYAAAYRYAVDNRLLTRFPGGVRWFRIILEDSTIQRRMQQVYAGYLKALISSRAA